MMKTPKKEMKANLLDLVEIGSDGTAIGKSTLANRISHLYREAGRPVTCVRIESTRRRGQDAGAADTDIFIPLEDFTTAAVRTGQALAANCYQNRRNSTTRSLIEAYARKPAFIHAFA